MITTESCSIKRSLCRSYRLRRPLHCTQRSIRLFARAGPGRLVCALQVACHVFINDEGDNREDVVAFVLRLNE